MKAWWDNPEYQSMTTDNKIAAWAEHCRRIECERDIALQQVAFLKGCVNDICIRAINLGQERDDI